MFCPECRTEYREGFIECADCSVPLVSELPPDPEDALKTEYVDYEHVLSTSNPGDIAIIKSLLDSRGLVYFFQGEHFSQIRPLLTFVAPARLMVRKDQVAKTRELLKDLDLNFMPLIADSPPEGNDES